MRSWWQRRSLRARLTLIATAALAVGITAGSLLLVRSFATSRLGAIDATSRSVSANLTNLAQAGALPQVLPVEPGETAQVTAADGGVLAASPGTLRTLPLLSLDRLRALARSGPGNTTTAGINGQSQSRVRVDAVDVAGGRDYVVVAASLADEHATVAGLSHAVLVGAPLLLLAVAATVWLLLGRALRTVDALRLGAQSIADPLTADRLPVPTGRDEVQHLATTLNAMLDRLAGASERERGFIADAAHELRSPVTAIQTQLEMSVTSSDPVAARDFANGALRDTERLGTLIQDLLALARLESAEHLPRRTVDLAAVAGISGAGTWPVLGDAASLARAVDNLRSNAQRHGTRVELSLERVGDVVALHVDDNGPGVPPDQRSRVFERLVRLDTSRTRDEGGAGLGLAIVAATARVHDGRVDVGDSPLGGARFTLLLPAADVQPAEAPRAGAELPSADIETVAGVAGPTPLQEMPRMG